MITGRPRVALGRPAAMLPIVVPLTGGTLSMGFRPLPTATEWSYLVRDFAFSGTMRSRTVPAVPARSVRKC